MTKVRCTSCNTELESTGPNDFQQCGCENKTFVDGAYGGFWRVGGMDGSKIRVYSETSKEWMKVTSLFADSEDEDCELRDCSTVDT